MNTSHETRSHARLSGSRIARALLCPGSIQLESTQPDQTNDAALKGTAIHEIADALLNGGTVPAQHHDKPDEWVQEAHGYARAILEYTAPWAKKRLVELNLDPGLRLIHESMGGTADYVAIGSGRLLVADLKTGRNDVSPIWNSQLMTYAVGAVKQLKAPDTIKVTLAIYQGGQLKTWDCAYPDLIDWADTLTELAKRVWADNPVREPSADACRYCRAKTVCPELADKARSIAASIANQEFGLVKEAAVAGVPGVDVDAITTDTLNTADLLQHWIDAVRDRAKQQLIQGREIAGWQLRKGRKMVQITDTAKLEAAAKAHPDAWTLKTPSALQKMGVFPSSLFRETSAAASLVKVDLS